MTTTNTSSGLAALRAWFAPALADRLAAHIARLDWRPDQLAEFQAPRCGRCCAMPPGIRRSTQPGLLRPA